MRKLVGTEKQIEWATQIIEAVEDTCNANIDKFEGLNMFPELVEEYKKVLATLKAVAETENGQNAGWVINHRDMFQDLVRRIK